MGQHNSNFELASEARRAAERFDECEIKVIKETFKDLCHLNGGSTRIDKDTFLQYLPLPGLLGERLFAVFDKKCSGEIDYEEFICGLAVTCRGSWDEKVEFIFNLYDMHGQGAVNRHELAALLNHVPKSIMRFGRAMSLDPASFNNHAQQQQHHHHHQQQRHHSQHHAEHHRHSRRSSAPSMSSHQSHSHHHPPRHPAPSSVGTVASGLSTGRCSPDPFLSAPAVAGAAAAGGLGETTADAGAYNAAAASGCDSCGLANGTTVPSVPGVGGELSGAEASEGGRLSASPGDSPRLLTSRNLKQLDASLSSRAIGGEFEGGFVPLIPGVLPGGLGDGEGGGINGGLTTEVIEKGTDAEGAADAPPAAAPVAAVPPMGGTGYSSESATAGAAANGAGDGDDGDDGGDGGGRAGAAAIQAGVLALEEESKEGNGESVGEGERARVPAPSLDAGVPPVQAEGEARGDAGRTGEAEGGAATEEAGADAEAVDAADVNPEMPPPSAVQQSKGEASGDGLGRSRRGTVRSDSSTEGGTSVAATQHHMHWEDFTNNDIVDQAFEECDLNHNGKLSFTEFRLWVERNPIVTQFLQSVFPYDEHREWGDDRKHLPFIHNREFTGSPMRSEPSVGGDAVAENSEDETRRLLIRARNTTRDEALRDSIDRLIEQVRASGAGSAGALAGADVASAASANGVTSPVDSVDLHIHQNCRSKTANFAAGLLSELSPRSAKVMQHQTVAKQGFLWKQGYRLRTWKQRWYVLVGNCIYYYHHEADVYPSKVMFLTGAFVEPLQEAHNERKGFWGIEIARNNEQSHRRKWYTRSKVDQLKWVKELRKASAVVPIEDDFEIGEELGKGRFSRVCMCVNKHTLERKAVKIITKAEMKQDEKELLRAEIAIMRLVNHPNIIRMEAVYESKRDIFIVMQLHSGGELFDRIVGRPRFSEDEAFTVMHPLVESVAYLHEMGIVHRDLKPENILCGERIEDIKIADFGLSKMVMPDEIMQMPCGTLSYVAPEVLTLNGYGKEADIWSVGTIMYLLLRGRLPFDGVTREEIIENTIHGTIEWQNDPVWANFSDDGKDLVLGMLNKDRTRRYTARDVLAHPWITQRELRREEHPEQFEF